MGLNLSSKNHIPEDKPTNVIPDPIGNLYLLSSKQVLCEDSTALRLNSSPKQTPLRTFESEQPTAVNEFQ